MSAITPLRSVSFGFFALLATVGCSAPSVSDESLVGTENELQERAPIASVVTTTARVNLRKGPSKSSEVIEILDEGVALVVLGEQDDWYNVRFEDPSNRTVGWVSGKYLQAEDNEHLHLGDEDAPATGDDEITDDLRPAPRPTARRFGGTFNQSPTVSFGGGEHCDFQQTLTDGVVSISVDASGRISAGKVTATSTEKILNGCTKSPRIPPQAQEWRLVRNDGGQLIFFPDEGNTPPSALVITGDFTKSPTTITLAWHRYDYPAPLDWRINMSMNVSAK